MIDEQNLEIDSVNVNKSVRIVFMGTPEFAVPVLDALFKNYNVKAVITQPDRKFGRDQKVIETPVKKLAKENIVLVLQPENIKDYVEEVLQLEPDLIVTCAYGQIIPDEILNYPRLGAINVHASLLPKLRGGAPIQRAIINGHYKTGITIMKMNRRLDAGDIISQKEIDILSDDTASSLHDKLSVLGKELLMETLPKIIDGTATYTKQDESEATYAGVIKRTDERLSFSKTKKQVCDHIRGLYSWPIAYCKFMGSDLKIYKAYPSSNFFPHMFDGQITEVYEDGFGVKVSNGEVIVTEVKLEGKTKMSAVDFARGYENKGGLVGKILS